MTDQVKYKRYKHSRQRERMLELLRSTDSHPTALWLYDMLRGEFPELSIGTIYRNLRVLMDQGLINKIDFGSTFDRFDANTAPHYHFICERCGTIADLPIPINNELNQWVKKVSRHNAHSHRIEFFGVCESCSLKNKKKK